MYDQYAYDELGQLIREDNKDANKSYTYTYDSRGNLLSKKTYAFTLGTLGTAQKTDTYGYATDSWKDRLTSYNGQTITYDSIGNPLTYNNGSAYTFTWEGRQMQTATKGNTTWTYTYNADGLRIGKTNGTTTYTYTWNENRQLSSMTWNTGYALFYYDANGTPNSVVIDDGYDVQTYCYVTNLQGDIVGLISAESGDWAVTYEYDAWGNLLDKKGYSSGYAGAYVYNPLTYKGYLYDEETGFYYLQSRYYDSTVGRFLNADSVLSIHPISSECNLFRYCNNNPINRIDETGTMAVAVATSGATYAAFVAWLSTLGSANFWNPVGWIILGVIAAGVITWAAVTLYNRWKASASSRTKKLSDVKAKEQTGCHYYLAYISNRGEIIKVGKKLSFVEAVLALGISGATNSITQRFVYSRERSSNAQRTLEHCGTGDWGIYADSQVAAKALAMVFSSTAKPEVHGSGMYGHYHDSTHTFHIWFGGKITY